MSFFKRAISTVSPLTALRLRKKRRPSDRAPRPLAQVIERTAPMPMGPGNALTIALRKTAEKKERISRITARGLNPR